MSHRIDGTPSEDQHPTDVFPQVPDGATASMDLSDLTPATPPPSHRRDRRVSALTVGAWLAGGLGLAMAGTALLLLSQGGGTSREQAPPPASLAVSLPPVEISVVPTTPHTPRRTTPRRRIVPAVPKPVATHSTPRPTVTPSPTPSAPVSPSPKPPTPHFTPTPEPTLTPPETPGVSGVAYASKETT